MAQVIESRFLGVPARLQPPPWRRATLAEIVAANTWRENNRRAVAAEELAQLADERQEAEARQPLTSGADDALIRRAAGMRADLLGRLIDASGWGMTAAESGAWLNAQLLDLQAGPGFTWADADPTADELQAAQARARCALWWRRRLRRAVVRMRETEAQARGEVSARRRQPYVTHDTAARRAARLKATAAMLEATELENEDGQVMTLADLSAVSVASKPIRRGELMTRLNGCERLADALSMPGVFLTLTTPSRFHAVSHRTGQPNPAHLEARAAGLDVTPRAAQQWLSGCWARARAKLQRLGLRVFGFRVAEPHHDGTPHWHGLLWTEAGQAGAVTQVIRAAWLKDSGDERGAARYRVKAKQMDPGGAVAYCAKYIAKNIDDAGAVGAEGHRDEVQTWDAAAVPEPVQLDAFGGTAQRVEAWASAWGIRQFQAIGQPPVTVWRELRRLPEAVNPCTWQMRDAIKAANRDGGQRADWARYVIAQGGICTGRRYSIRLHRVEAFRRGRYGSGLKMLPAGVAQLGQPGEIHISDRKEWRPRGEWAPGDRGAGGLWAPRAHPWTRVNNCTRAPGPTIIAGEIQAPRARLRTWLEIIEASNGGSAVTWKARNYDPHRENRSHRERREA